MKALQITTLTLFAGLAWAAAPVATSQPAVRETRVVSNDSTYAVTYSVLTEEVEMAELFSIRLRVERLDGEPGRPELAVDARMPEHGHGMNREPRVERLEDGSFEATNLLFHMPGYWEVYLDLTEGALTERAQFSIELD